MFSIISTGSPGKTDAYLAKMVRKDIYSKLDLYGRMGVSALSSATPVDSGETAAAWYYKIVRKGTGVTIEWRNSNVVDDVPIAIILHYGHGTGTGGYVQGREFINTAIQPVMDQIAAEVWKVVTSA